MDRRLAARSEEELERMAEEEEARRKRREIYYCKETGRRYQRPRRRHIYLFTPEDLQTAEVPDMVSQSPVYRRDKAALQAIRQLSARLSAPADAAADGADDTNAVINF